MQSPSVLTAAVQLRDVFELTHDFVAPTGAALRLRANIAEDGRMFLQLWDVSDLDGNGGIHLRDFLFMHSVTGLASRFVELRNAIEHGIWQGIC